MKHIVMLSLRVPGCQSEGRRRGSSDLANKRGERECNPSRRGSAALTKCMHVKLEECRWPVGCVDSYKWQDAGSSG